MNARSDQRSAAEYTAAMGLVIGAAVQGRRSRRVAWPGPLR